MPPNVQPLTNENETKNNDEEQQQQQPIMKLKDHFWSCDTKGIDQLMVYLNKSTEDLNQLQELYLERAELEFQFGQKLDALAKSFTFSSSGQQSSTKNEQGQKNGVSAALLTVNKELFKSSQSHINLSQRLKNNVATSLKEWIEKHQNEIDQIKNHMLNSYQELQDHVEQLYNVREEYQSLERENPKRQTLQNDYRILLNKIDNMVKKYNEDWNNSCDQIEELEQDRIEFFATNVWDYANLASARLMIQDQRCEEIRNQLELCTAEEELNYCIQEASVGKRVPTTSDYVSYYFNNKKSSSSTPLPKKKKTTQNLNKELPKPNPQPRSQPSSQDKLPEAVSEAIEPPAPVPPITPTTSFSSTVKRKPIDESTYKDKKKSAPAALEELLKKFESKTDSVRQKQPTLRKQYSSQQQQRSSPLQHFDSNKNRSISPVNNKNNSGNTISNNNMKTIKENEDQNKNHHHHQKEKESINDINKSGDSSVQDHTPPSSSIADENKKITDPIKDINKEKEENNISTTPVMPPKSPRPKPNQVIAPSPSPIPMESFSSHPQHPHHYHHHQQQQQHPSSRNIPSPINTSYNYLQQQQIGTLSNNNSMVSPSPMISPNIAPASPMLYSGNHVQQHQQQQQYHTLQPTHSPMMQHQQQQSYIPSPNMVNAIPHSPILLPTNNYQYNNNNNNNNNQYNLNTNIPASPHISRPNSPYLTHHQPSLSPRPSSPCIPRPTLLPDRREILFWCHALYDYIAQEPSELSFSAQELFAVYNTDPDGWWEAISWDGYYFGREGSIPSNYMQQC